MLLKTISFDANNINWINNRDHNFMFLRMTEQYVNDTIRHRGYMYLNQICELLGAGWNPEDENPCIKNDGVARVAFVQFETFNQPNSSFLMYIHCYD